MPYMKQGQPWLYDNDTGDVVGYKDADGGEFYFGGGASGVPDGDKGDIVVSSSGTVWQIKPGVVANGRFTPVSVNTSVSESGKKLLVDATAGDVVITLASAATINDVTIKRIDGSANAVTIVCNGAQTIDGGTTAVLINQYESISLFSDGVNWFIA